MIKGILVGILGTLVVLAIAAYVVLSTGIVPANADGPMLPLERWAASRSLHASIDRALPGLNDPLQPDAANVLAGAKLYAAHCAICHGASDGRPTYVGFGLYQHAPVFGRRRRPMDDPDGEIYWKITHGVRFTGMPSFGKTLADDDRWRLTLFLKHLTDLPPAAQAVWTKTSVPTVPLSLLPPRPPRGAGPSGP